MKEGGGGYVMCENTCRVGLGLLGTLGDGGKVGCGGWE